MYTYIYIYKHILIYTYKQGVSRLVDITVGGDFLGLSDQNVHTNKCRIWTVTELWAYFNSRTRPRANRVTEPTSWRVMYSTWCLIVCVASIIFAT